MSSRTAFHCRPPLPFPDGHSKGPEANLSRKAENEISLVPSLEQYLSLACFPPKPEGRWEVGREGMMAKAQIPHLFHFLVLGLEFVKNTLGKLWRQGLLFLLLLLGNLHVLSLPKYQGSWTFG